jgi:hypothetical protein
MTRWLPDVGVELGAIPELARCALLGQVRTTVTDEFRTVSRTPIAYGCGLYRDRLRMVAVSVVRMSVALSDYEPSATRGWAHREPEHGFVALTTPRPVAPAPTHVSPSRSTECR